MAGLAFVVNAAEASTTTSLKTMLQIVAATNIRAHIKEWSCAFQGTSNTAAPILVQVYLQTGAGTSSAATISKLDTDAAETLQTTALETFTAEPTRNDTLIMQELVHPQTGYTWQAPFGGEIPVNGGNRLGFLVTAGAAVDCTFRVVGEE